MSNQLLAWTAVCITMIIAAVFLIVHVSGWFFFLFFMIPSIHGEIE